MAERRASGWEVRNLRRRLWKRQNKLCHWCDHETILPEDLLNEYINLEDLRRNGYGHAISELTGRLMVQEPAFARRWRRDLATVDHLIEHAIGGTYDEENLVVACNPCNSRRGGEFHRRMQKLASVHGEVLTSGPYDSDGTALNDNEWMLQ